MVHGEENWMSGGAAMRGLLAVAVLAVGAAAWAPVAIADTAGIIAPSDPHNPQVDSGWQAGTCSEEPPESTDFCSVATPSQFFEQAAGHPDWGFTQFIVKHKAPGETPVGELKTVHVDLPVGLSVNPGATPRCQLAEFEASSCDPDTEVGESLVTASVLGVPIDPISGVTRVPVYNLVPLEHEPARFGLLLAGNEVFLEADVAWSGDFHEGFTIAVPKALPLEIPLLVEGAILKNRLVFDGRAGDGTFITTPSTCLGEGLVPPHEHDYSTYLLAGSYAEEAEPGYEFPAGAEPPFESPIPPGTEPRECGTIPYEPSIGVDPDTAQTDSPSGAEVDVHVPHISGEGGEGQDSSDTRTAAVTLPPGMGLNPSAASGGLQVCGDEQFGIGSSDENGGCPSASKIGTVSIESPPLPEGILSGKVYVGRQLSRDPLSGDEYRIFVEAGSRRYGVFVRLEGKVSADPLTGRLTTTFSGREFSGLEGLPQVPFSAFKLDFDDGAHAVLTSPTTCGPNGTAAEMIPWSGNAAAHTTSDFTLTDAPGGGKCAKSGAERPFAPGFAAHTAKPQGGAYSPLSIDVSRPDGRQELKGVEVDLPPGVSGKLAGLSYCSEGALAIAAAKGGAEEAVAPSCPASSWVGGADIVSGTGPAPVQIAGKVFLAGPYKGAPLSLAVVTPATAGPFDLGTVVVRVALYVNPETAQIHAASDPIPHVYGGALLDIRSISVHADRPGFSLNPTNCAPLATVANLHGGADDPNNPAGYSSYLTSSFFQVHGCEGLGFRPKLFMRLFGGSRRTKHPKLRAVLQARGGDANIARAAVTLPKALILDQANLAKVCTRVQFAARACPRKSIYGFARAFTPLLDRPLEGPVYLRSSDNELPDLVSDLHGQVPIVLDSRTDSVHGRIRNTFDTTPDVPVSKFVLTLRGGRKGLLVNSKNLCPRRHKGGKRAGASTATHRLRHRKHRRKGLRAVAHFKAWDGKKRNLKPRLRLPCGKKRHRHGH
jgi:hypothetical protein